MQVLAKSCKMVPVMIMGTLIGGKVYGFLDYGCATLIAAGISLFANQSSTKVIKKLEAPNAPLGYFLCFLNLFFDGYTNAKQVHHSPVSLCCSYSVHTTLLPFFQDVVQIHLLEVSAFRLQCYVVNPFRSGSFRTERSTIHTSMYSQLT